MTNTKLVEFISVLSADEMLRLQQFVTAAYHNTSQRAQQLFVLLQKEYPAFEETAIADKKIFTLLFGNKKKFSDALLRNVVSDLYAVCEQFAIAETLQHDAGLNHQLLAKYLVDKKLFAQAEVVLHRWQADLEKLPRDEVYFLGVFRWLHASFSIAFHRHYKGNLHKLYKKKNAAELFDKLQDYYLFEFAALSAEVANSFKQHNQSFDTKGLLQTITYYQQHRQNAHPLVLLRLQLSQLLLSDDESLYLPVKKYFLRVYQQTHRTDRQTMLVWLHGFAAARAWQGNSFFKNELEELNLLRIKLNLILDENNEINPIAFWNLGEILLRKKGKKATDEFVKKYNPNLPASTRSELLQLVNVLMWIEEKKYAAALQQLLTVGKPFFASEIVYRRMLLTCYYELKQWDMLQSAIETTEKFLRNNATHLAPQVAHSFKKYIEALRLLYRITTENNSSAKSKLRELLQTNPGTYNVGWIEKKLK